MENKSKRNTFHEVAAILEQNTRGVQIVIYSIAGLSLAYAIHRVRPISKFSRATDVPSHFLKEKEVLRGRVVGWEPSTDGARILLDHKPPLRIPLWHSKKEPLPVQIWGVKLVGANGINWLQCVATGQEASIIPLSRGKDALISDVTLHLPIFYSKNVDKNKKKLPQFEDLKVGERLVELGFAVVTPAAAKIPIKTDNKWFWLPWGFFQRSDAEILQRAQSRAMAHRAGFWQDKLPSSKFSILIDYLKQLIPFKRGKQTSTMAT